MVTAPAEHVREECLYIGLCMATAPAEHVREECLMATAPAEHVREECLYAWRPPQLNTSVRSVCMHGDRPS